MSTSDVLVENPAWKVAREALQTLDDGKSKQEQTEHHPKQATGQQYLNKNQQFPMPPPPPFGYNFNHGYNFYPPPEFYGRYNHRPGPAYPYSPHQQFDAPPCFPPPGFGQGSYPMYNQNPTPLRSPHMPHNGVYQQNQMMQPPPPQQDYDPSRPTDEDDNNKTIYQRAEVHYEESKKNGKPVENRNGFEDTSFSSGNYKQSNYPSPWIASSQGKSNDQLNHKSSYADAAKENHSKKKAQVGGFKMTFVNSSGAKKFKPAWQPVDSKPNNVEEKENSGTYDQDCNDKMNSNSFNEKPHRQEHVSNDNDSQEKKSKEWPPALKIYVKHSFERCKNEAEKDYLEKHLKELLTRVLEDGTAYTIDWDNYALPNMEQLMARKRLNKPEKRRSSSNSRSQYRSTSRSRSRSPMNRRGSRGEKHIENVRGKPERGRGKREGRGRGRGQRAVDDVYELSKKNNKNWMIPSPPSSPDIEDPELSKKKQSRANRFYETLKEVKDSGKKVSSTLNVYSTADDEEDFDWSQFHIVGTCQDLTKRYLRLTSAPDPAMVRPLKILEKSLDLVKQRWKSKPDYHFTCEQLKAIRQDLTVQGIRNDFTVEVYETHARTALEKGDREEFNQCQTCLKSLYKEGCNGHPDEFTAYKIIYDIYTDNYLDMSNCLVSLSAELKKSDAVTHALSLRSAWVLCNYHSFFQLYLTAPNMSGYLIDLFAERVRKQALKIMFKSYRPSLPVKFIESELAFTEEGACALWLKELGASFTKDSLSIDTKASIGIFSSS